jgi:TetR/AcrR family transcriptional regulator
MTKSDLKHPHSDKPDSRQRILDAALDEFTEFGLSGARVDRIAAAAGVNKAMLYYYFASKENLYKQAVQEFVGSKVRSVHQCMSEAKSLEEGLSLVAEMYAELFLNHPERIRLFARELADPDSQIVKAFIDMATDTGLPDEIRGAFAAGVKAGELREVDVAQAFASFITMNIGYFLMSPIIDRVWKIGDRREFVEQRKRAVVDLFLHGVKSR